MNPVTNYIINLIGDNPDTRKAIKDIVYFGNASESMLDLIIRYGKIVELRQDEVIIKQGDYDQWIYIILNGTLDVYLGSQKIDSTTASLVGERCILGESRKATLKAQTDGVVVLGIDMAIIDELGKEDSPEADKLKASGFELLCVITSVVYSRICQLWFYQIGKKKIASRIFEADMLQNSVVDMLFNKFSDHGQANEYFTYFIQQHFPADKDKFMQNGRINTRELVLFMQRHNHSDLFEDLMDSMAAQFYAEETRNFEDQMMHIKTFDMEELSEECFAIVQQTIDGGEELKQRWSHLLSQVSEAEPNIYQFLKNISDLFPFSLSQQLDVIYAFLKLFTKYNDSINKNTGKIYQLYSLISLKEVYGSRGEDMLNFSMTGDSIMSEPDNVEKYLIRPYLDSLRRKHTKPSDEKESAATAPEQKAEEPKTAADGQKAEEPKSSSGFSQDDIDKMFS